MPFDADRFINSSAFPQSTKQQRNVIYFEQSSRLTHSNHRLFRSCTILAGIDSLKLCLQRFSTKSKRKRRMSLHGTPSTITLGEGLTTQEDEVLSQHHRSVLNCLVIWLKDWRTAVLPMATTIFCWQGVPAGWSQLKGSHSRLITGDRARVLFVCNFHSAWNLSQQGLWNRCNFWPPGTAAINVCFLSAYINCNRRYVTYQSLILCGWRLLTTLFQFLQVLSEIFIQVTCW